MILIILVVIAIKSLSSFSNSFDLFLQNYSIMNYPFFSPSIEYFDPVDHYQTLISMHTCQIGAVKYLDKRTVSQKFFDSSVIQ